METKSKPSAAALINKKRKVSSVLETRFQAIEGRDYRFYPQNQLKEPNRSKFLLIIFEELSLQASELVREEFGRYCDQVLSWKTKETRLNAKRSIYVALSDIPEMTPTVEMVPREPTRKKVMSEYHSHVQKLREVVNAHEMLLLLGAHDEGSIENGMARFEYLNSMEREYAESVLARVFVNPVCFDITATTLQFMLSAITIRSDLLVSEAKRRDWRIRSIITSNPNRLETVNFLLKKHFKSRAEPHPLCEGITQIVRIPKQCEPKLSLLTQFGVVFKTHSSDSNHPVIFISLDTTMDSLMQQSGSGKIAELIEQHSISKNKTQKQEEVVKKTQSFPRTSSITKVLNYLSTLGFSTKSWDAEMIAKTTLRLTFKSADVFSKFQQWGEKKEAKKLPSNYRVELFPEKKQAHIIDITAESGKSTEISTKTSHGSVLDAVELLVSKGFRVYKPGIPDSELVEQVCITVLGDTEDVTKRVTKLVLKNHTITSGDLLQ